MLEGAVQRLNWSPELRPPAPSSFCFSLPIACRLYPPSLQFEASPIAFLLLAVSAQLSLRLQRDRAGPHRTRATISTRANPTVHILCSSSELVQGEVVSSPAPCHRLVSLFEHAGKAADMACRRPQGGAFPNEAGIGPAVGVHNMYLPRSGSRIEWLLSLIDDVIVRPRQSTLTAARSLPLHRCRVRAQERMGQRCIKYQFAHA